MTSGQGQSDVAASAAATVHHLSRVMSLDAAAAAVSVTALVAALSQPFLEDAFVWLREIAGLNTQSPSFEFLLRRRGFIVVASLYVDVFPEKWKRKIGRNQCMICIGLREY